MHIIIVVSPHNEPVELFCTSMRNQVLHYWAHKRLRIRVPLQVIDNWKGYFSRGPTTAGLLERGSNSNSFRCPPSLCTVSTYSILSEIVMTMLNCRVGFINLPNDGNHAEEADGQRNQLAGRAHRIHAPDGIPRQCELDREKRPGYRNEPRKEEVARGISCVGSYNLELTKRTSGCSKIFADFPQSMRMHDVKSTKTN
jgi:hypothetical protein